MPKRDKAKPPEQRSEPEAAPEPARGERVLPQGNFVPSEDPQDAVQAVEPPRATRPKIAKHLRTHADGAHEAQAPNEKKR